MLGNFLEDVSNSVLLPGKRYVSKKNVKANNRTKQNYERTASKFQS